MIKKICAVVALSAAAVFGSAGAASADGPGTEFRGGWVWWLGSEVAEFSSEVADSVVDVRDNEVTILGWTWLQ